jgi:hypothetical protein
MTFAAPDSIASGSPYQVVKVGGHSPESLKEFIGDTEFVIEGLGERHIVAGIGTLETDEVRFQEKDVRHDGKDVRVWQITGADHSFIAKHAAAI